MTPTSSTDFLHPAFPFYPASQYIKLTIRVQADQNPASTLDGIKKAGSQVHLKASPYTSFSQLATPKEKPSIEVHSCSDGRKAASRLQ